MHRHSVTSQIDSHATPMDFFLECCDNLKGALWNRMEILRKSAEFLCKAIEILQDFYENPMESYGNPMDMLGNPYGNPLEILRESYGNLQKSFEIHRNA